MTQQQYWTPYGGYAPQMAAQQAPHPYGAPYGAPYGQPVLPSYGVPAPPSYGAPAAYPAAPAAFNPSALNPSPFRSAGAAYYDEDMSSSESSSLHGGARRLNSKAKAKAAIWREQVMAYKESKGVSLKEAMIAMSKLRKKASRKSRR